MLPLGVLLVFAFAAYRVARFVTADTLTMPMRTALYDFAWQSTRVVGQTPDGAPIVVPLAEPVPKAPWRTHVYDFAVCPFCVGVWASVGVYVAWRYGPSWLRACVVVAAIAGAQGFLASRGEQ